MPVVRHSACEITWHLVRAEIEALLCLFLAETILNVGVP